MNLKVYKLIRAYFPLTKEEVGTLAMANQGLDGGYFSKHYTYTEKEIEDYSDHWLRVQNYQVMSYTDIYGQEFTRVSPMKFLNVYGSPLQGYDQIIDTASVMAVYSGNIYRVGESFKHALQEKHKTIIEFAIFQFSCKVIFSDHSEVELMELDIHPLYKRYVAPPEPNQFILMSVEKKGEVWMKGPDETAFRTGTGTTSRTIGNYDLLRSSKAIPLLILNTRNGHELGIGDLVDINGNQECYIREFVIDSRGNVEAIKLQKLKGGSKCKIYLSHDNYKDIKQAEQGIFKYTCGGYAYYEDRVILLNKKTFTYSIGYAKNLSGVYDQRLHWAFKSAENMQKFIRNQKPVTISAFDLFTLSN